MKKYLFGIVALALVALSVTFVVRASDSSKENKKAKTEMVKEAHECGAAHTCCHEKGDKTACDPAKCKETGCDPAKCKKDCCDPAKCETACTKDMTDKKCDKSKCDHKK